MPSRPIRDEQNKGKFQIIDPVLSLRKIFIFWFLYDLISTDQTIIYFWVKDLLYQEHVHASVG